jgi:hypothetical protein
LRWPFATISYPACSIFRKQIVFKPPQMVPQNLESKCTRRSDAEHCFGWKAGSGANQNVVVGGLAERVLKVVR